MSKTVYTFHAAYDHSIVAQTSDSSAFAEITEHVAEMFDQNGTKRFYLHNGHGVVSAFLTRNGVASQILRDDYMQFSGKAKQARMECSIED